MSKTAAAPAPEVKPRFDTTGAPKRVRDFFARKEQDIAAAEIEVVELQTKINSKRKFLRSPLGTTTGLRSVLLDELRGAMPVIDLDRLEPGDLGEYSTLLMRLPTMTGAYSAERLPADKWQAIWGDVPKTRASITAFVIFANQSSSFAWHHGIMPQGCDVYFQYLIAGGDSPDAMIDADAALAQFDTIAKQYYR